MRNRCTLGANIDTTLYEAFTCYCERNKVTISEMLRDFVTYCVVSQMPDYEFRQSCGGLVKNKDIINYFKSKP